MTLKPTYFLPHKMLFAGLLCLLLIATPAWASKPLESYRYRQQTGEKIEYFDWLLEKSGDLVLTATSETETFLTVMNSNLSTRGWTVINPKQHTDIKAQRQADNIVLNGRWHGQTVQKVLHIDDAPWYQALSLSMRAVMDSSEESMAFWTLRPDELKPLKLKAVKKGMEVLNIGGRSIQAQKIEIRLTGMGALLGHSLYWLRPGDGLFLKYQGPIGLPGMACTVITLERTLLSSTDAPSTILCNRLNSLPPSSNSTPEHP